MSHNYQNVLTIIQALTQVAGARDSKFSMQQLADCVGNSLKIMRGAIESSQSRDSDATMAAKFVQFSLYNGDSEPWMTEYL
jgi:hypothetical protein